MIHHSKMEDQKNPKRDFKFVIIRLKIGKKIRSLVCFLLLIPSFIIMTSRIAVTIEEPYIESRPEHWAQSFELEGVPNFYKVTDTLYRGAQPTAEGMHRLKKLGIKTVVNLRSLHSDKNEIGDIELQYEHIPMIWHPTEEEVVRFLQIVTDTNRAPFFVHCMQGADRTGIMCAIYRLAVCGWTKEEAVSEMTTGGFGYHKIWTNLIRFIEDLEIPKIKRRAKIKD